MVEDAKDWLARVGSDLSMAEGAIEKKEYMYVAFFCQQALEKTLKAIIIDESGKLPPRTHSLVDLAQFAKITLDEEKKKLYSSLTAYYVESRYPNGKGQLTIRLDDTSAAGLLSRTKDEIEWLKSSLK